MKGTSLPMTTGAELYSEKSKSMREIIRGRRVWKQSSILWRKFNGNVASYYQLIFFGVF